MLQVRGMVHRYGNKGHFFDKPYLLGKQNVPGRPIRFIAMHLIVTPEYFVPGGGGFGEIMNNSFV